MKTPITYYGGKQKLAKLIISNIQPHNLYAEPFTGGAAVFFQKEPSNVEVLNDTNAELMNFYRVVQNDFIALEKYIRITLHSRRSYEDAIHINKRPHLFNEVERAWAIWTLSAQGFSGLIDGKSWGYDVAKHTTSLKIANKRCSFTEELAIRLQKVQLECTDAIRIIESRDSEKAFFYCDPPYVGSDCGHYDGYSQKDFDCLLEALSNIKGKFLLSSYRNANLTAFKQRLNWHQIEVQQNVSVNKGSGKAKIEVMTANYPISADSVKK